MIEHPQNRLHRAVALDENLRARIVPTGAAHFDRTVADSLVHSNALHAACTHALRRQLIVRDSAKKFCTLQNECDEIREVRTTWPLMIVMSLLSSNTATAFANGLKQG
eukprot:6192840-Pleurochrysis_carterae.AAC.2